MTAEFDTFLLELSQALEISPLKPDAKGACLLVFNKDEASFLFEYDESLVPRTILISCEICPIPLQIMTDILEESLLENEKMECTLSCHPSEDTLYLHRRVHPSILSNELKPLIKNMLEIVKIWRQKVKDQSLLPPKRQRIPMPPQIDLRSFKV